MSKIVTLTFLISDATSGIVDIKNVIKNELLERFGINTSVNIHDYPDRSELSKWDRLDAALPVECKDACCNQAV